MGLICEVWIESCLFRSQLLVNKERNCYGMTWHKLTLLLGLSHVLFEVSYRTVNLLLAYSGRSMRDLTM